MTKPQWSRATGISDLEGDGPFAVSADGVDVVLARVGQTLVAYDGVCPHQGALLGEGEFDGASLICRNHRWTFDASTGKRAGGLQCLTPCPVKEEDDSVWVDVSALLRERQAKSSAENRRSLGDLPGPPRLPFIGSAHKLDVESIHLTIESWAQKYGSAFRLKIGGTNGLAISDPAMVQEAMRARPDTFRRVSNVKEIFGELGLEGVFSAEEPSWRPLRRLSMQALANRHLKGFYDTLHDVAERLLARWQVAAEADRETDLEDDLKRFTVDVTTRLVFGYDINTLEKGDDIIQRHLEVIFPGLARRLTALMPLWRLVRMPRDRRLDRAVKGARDFLTEILTDTRARMEADPTIAQDPSNFLEAMLAARDQNGEPFSDAALLGNGLTMLLAGEDTTANTIAWAVHELLDAPEAVGLLREQIDENLHDDAIPATLEIADALNYATAIANETMRLRPVAPMIFLETLVDTSLADIDLPAGTPVFAITRTGAMDESNFTDAESFQPERWLSKPTGGRAHTAAAHVPFGSGPRICPGRSLALLEMRVIFALLYKNFDVERIGDRNQVGERFSFVMVPDGLRVRLRPRPGIRSTTHLPKPASSVG